MVSVYKPGANEFCHSPICNLLRKHPRVAETKPKMRLTALIVLAVVALFAGAVDSAPSPQTQQNKGLDLTKLPKAIALIARTPLNQR
ncbi:unnamed protein product [Spodoptera littoralis]|uniref:Uncharacterized protein n=1 Tax=Spodoptera littoralis TaxID=7109 RepID=A0A9P0MZW8_SPOLI|nr:unnamed protein product [Spodoptera littoralis]CAH1636473.1 unnamed protein product [Spodoptera littoralis]